MMTVSSTQIVQYLSEEYPYLESTHYGDVNTVSNVNKLTAAKKEDLTYATEYDEKKEVINSDGGIVICRPELADIINGTRIAVSDPRAAFIIIFDNFFRREPPETEVHPSATVSDEAIIGKKCVIGPNVYIGPDVKIGDRCVIQSGSSIGGDGFGFARDDSGKLYKQAHLGGVIIEDDVELGSNNSVDAGVFDPTVIKSGTKTDNLVHIAHEAVVGSDVMITYCCGLSGNAQVGDYCYLHPGALIANYVVIGEGCEIGMNSSVLNDIEPYSLAVGTPAKEVGESRYAD
jgi:UDP-3-O-[3-hydroxymyristoyl] glucosamine N-acyltransferase